MSSRATNAPLEKELALGLAEATPDAVRLADGEGVGAALCNHRRTAPAHLLGAHFTLTAMARPRSPSGWKNIDESTPRQRPDICQSQMSAFGPGNCWAVALGKPLSTHIFRERSKA